MVSRRVLGYETAFELTGEGPDVVLVHGIGVSGRYFRALTGELRGRARVLVPDLPGFGDSPRPEKPLTVAAHADVVAALCAELGLDRPVLVGHSMGTQIVTEAALRHPGLASGVVLVGPVADPRARTGPRQAWRLFRDAFREPPSGVALQLREWARCGPRWFLATLPHMLGHPLEDRIPDVDVPLVIARGERDPVAPPAYVQWLADRADARVLQVPRAGHLAMFRRPQYVANAALTLAARS